MGVPAWPSFVTVGVVPEMMAAASGKLSGSTVVTALIISPRLLSVFTRSFEAVEMESNSGRMEFLRSTVYAACASAGVMDMASTLKFRASKACWVLPTSSARLVKPAVLACCRRVCRAVLRVWRWVSSCGVALWSPCRKRVEDRRTSCVFCMTVSSGCSSF